MFSTDSAPCLQIVDLLEQLPSPHRSEIALASQEHEVRRGDAKLMPALWKLSPDRRELAPDAAVHQHRQPASIVPLARQRSRPVLHSLPDQPFKPVSAGESPLDDRFEIIRNKDQVDIPAIVEPPDELPHAIVRIGLEHLDVSDLPVRSSQHEHFGELRQVACRLKQPEIPRRRSPFDDETPDRRADRRSEARPSFAP